MDPTPSPGTCTDLQKMIGRWKKCRPGPAPAVYIYPIRLSPRVSSKTHPKKNILLPLNRFCTPYQNSLQQYTTYHIPYIPPSNIIFIFSSTLSNVHSSIPLSLNGWLGESHQAHERRVEGSRTPPNLAILSPPPKFAGSFPVHRWSGWRSTAPSKRGYRTVSRPPLETV